MLRFASVIALCVLCGGLSPAGLLAQNEIKPELERDVLQTTAAFLERGHLGHRKPDDEISERAFKAFLDELDPNRVYFFAGDIDVFRGMSRSFDDFLRNGKLEFVEKVCKMWQLRIEQAAGRVERLLKKELDLSDDERWITEREDLPWPKDDREMDDRWRQRLELDMLGLLVDGKERPQIKEELLKRYRRFAERVAKENREDRLSRFLGSICKAYDPHTTYMAPSAWQDFLMGVTLNYQGIGAMLSEEDGYVTISSVIDGGAVKEQGKIKDGDKILAVGQGRRGELTDITGWRSRDAVKLIRGKDGTYVRLKIRPADGGPERVDVLARKRIQLEDRGATSEIIPVGAKPDGGEWKVGVIDLPGFYRDRKGEESGNGQARSSARDCERFIAEFRKQGVDVCILDLRRNGGGYLSEAIDVTGLFIDRGPVVQVKGNGRPRVRRDRDGGMAWKGPLVVLTSRASASASEIVAGAIQDWRRGVVVGDRTTHGKGTVQTTTDMAAQIGHEAGSGSLGILKYTIQQFYRPNGDGTQVKGVESDVVLPAWTGVTIPGEDELPNAFPFTRIQGVRFDPLDQMSPIMARRLQEASDARRRKDAHYRELERRLAVYRSMKASKSLPLEEKAYRELQEALEEVNKEQKEEAEEKKERRFADDPWFREVLLIAIDYAGLLADRKA